MNCKLRFHHVGIACRDIEATKTFYLGLGHTVSETEEDSIQNVFICFLSKNGEPRLELLAPVTKTAR